MSTKTMIVVGALVAVILAVLSRILVPVPMPEILLPAEKIVDLGFMAISNSILATWLTIIVLVVMFWLATRKMEMIPSGLQNFAEAIVEAALSFIEGIAGKENGRKFFALVATIFLFVITSNWLGLLPGFGTIGLFEHKDHGVVATQVGPLALIVPGQDQPSAEAQNDHGPAVQEGDTVMGVIVPFFRSANTDLNTTLALALVAFLMIEWWGAKAHGVWKYSSKFINVKGGPIGFVVGIIELVTEIARIISFSFRLFGNVFAGEVLLAVLMFLVPWLVVVPFFGLELFVGFIQALVFAMLTLVFSVVACAGHGEEHAKAH
ncbi:MAG: ATP synthase F0 subunit A [Chloroflexota bacterium]|nr:MAG: ATP synthase F0 subunit A [Chloroflexota bacterium]